MLFKYSDDVIKVVVQIYIKSFPLSNKFSSHTSVQTESRKRKRKSEAGDQDHESSDSAGSAVSCPVKKHECHLYDLYRSKWWVPYKSLQS